MTTAKDETIIEDLLLDPSPSEQQNSISSLKSKTLSVSSNSVVTKSNDLIQKTRYALPKTQQKILLAMIAQIDPKRDNDPNKIYTMSFNTFSKLTGADMRSQAYRVYLKNTIKKLADSSFWVDEGDKESELYRWISGGTKIDFENKKINMRFSAEIFPYLTQLKSNYTSFNVEYMLKMNSTYSMRFYEILLSYDNGDVDYGYTNGVTFQPTSDKFLHEKFPQSASRLKGYKYKVFDIRELKLQLSSVPDSENVKGAEKKDRPLTEKYANYKDFDKYVLRRAKEEINAMTDLWFDYIPARIKGEGRKGYQLIYLFIKYKTANEIRKMRENSTRKEYAEDDVCENRKNKKEMVQEETNIESAEKFICNDICYMTVTKATRVLEKKAEYDVLRMRLNADYDSMVSSILVYVARLLTNKNPRKAHIAEETLDALNRVLAHNEGTLKYWIVGMAAMMFEKKRNGQLKSPQYNATIIYNAIEDIKIIKDGKEKLKEAVKKNLFTETDWVAAFED